MSTIARRILVVEYFGYNTATRISVQATSLIYLSSPPMLTNAPLLIVQDVRAGYIPGSDILNGINFVVQPGELVAVIGGNGAGKSTLAKTIFGLLTPNSGTITFKGEQIGGLKSDRIVQRGMCYVPQISNVFKSLTIEENLDMGGFIRSSDLQQLKQKIYTMFPRLAERRKQRAGTLSGGERQMLAMGKALMLDPELLVLDEPSAALSPALVTDVLKQIRAINETGTAIVLVEQNAKKALAMSDRAYVLDTGIVKHEGVAADLLKDPKVIETYLGVGGH
jgi:neutral amino acid transport system ATP-binding protein